MTKRNRCGFIFGCVLTVAGLVGAVEPSDVVGSWDVKLDAKLSTCDNVATGDINAFQLVIRVEGGKVKAETLGTKKAKASYKGQLNGNQLWLHDRSDGHDFTIEATIDGSTMKGIRVVGNAVPCVIIYDLSAKKL